MTTYLCAFRNDRYESVNLFAGWYVASIIFLNILKGSVSLPYLLLSFAYMRLTMTANITQHASRTERISAAVPSVRPSVCPQAVKLSLLNSRAKYAFADARKPVKSDGNTMSLCITLEYSVTVGIMPCSVPHISQKQYPTERPRSHDASQNRRYDCRNTNTPSRTNTADSSAVTVILPALRMNLPSRIDEVGYNERRNDKRQHGEYSF